MRRGFQRELLSYALLFLIGAWLVPTVARAQTGAAPTSATAEAAPAPAQAAEPPSAGAEAPAAPEGMTWDRFLRNAGKFHLLILHFPIALLLAAALAEFLSLFSAARGLPATSRFCLWLAAISAVIAAPLGWALAAGGGYPETELFWHRWLGTATAVMAPATLAAGELARRPGRTGWVPLYRVMLLFSAGLVGAAGHFGGLLVHGYDYFDFS